MSQAANSGLTRQTLRRWVKMSADSEDPSGSDNPKDTQWHTTW